MTNSAYMNNFHLIFCFRFLSSKAVHLYPARKICDVVGVVSFVGRLQREKKRDAVKTDSSGTFWMYRWISLHDGNVPSFPSTHIFFIIREVKILTVNYKIRTKKLLPFKNNLYIVDLFRQLYHSSSICTGNDLLLLS